MSIEEMWNDKSRNELEERLRSVVLGELRLGKRQHDEILEKCCEVYIDEDAPEHEHERLIEFTTAEIQRIANQLTSEQETWPEVTDSDRLDRVDAALRERGILLWQASPCCDTCTGGELGDRAREIGQRFPGFGERLCGYAFFIDQNLPEMLADSTDLSVYLGYGWFSPDDSETTSADYEAKALGIAHQVCDCLREHGFEPDWNGSFSRKIGVSLNWQRRTLLE